MGLVEFRDPYVVGKLRTFEAPTLEELKAKVKKAQLHWDNNVQ